MPLLQGYGFTIPDPDLRWNKEENRWEIGPIDWEPLKRTLAMGGPDSARRISEASESWEKSSWVREALEKVAT